MTEFETLGPIGRPEAEGLLASQEPQTVSRTLLRLALNHEDWRWVQGRCVEFSAHPDVWVRRNCATALGHLARLHRELDLEIVLPVLAELQADPEVKGWADCAVDDLTIFLPETEDDQ